MEAISGGISCVMLMQVGGWSQKSQRHATVQPKLLAHDPARLQQVYTWEMYVCTNLLAKIRVGMLRSIILLCCSRELPKEHIQLSINKIIHNVHMRW